MVACRLRRDRHGQARRKELNAGSDVDLIFFYDADEGSVTPLEGAETASGAVSISLQEYWQRVAKRLTATLEDVTEDGQVWRVDLRLRPEGSTGPLVISLAAAERYYESFGRLWERAAMLRARPVAGDRALGDVLLESLSSFVWRRRIDPVATELVQLVKRGERSCARIRPATSSSVPGYPRGRVLRASPAARLGRTRPNAAQRGTLVALARLESKGLCTQREAVDIADGYLALRRAEHAVQVTSGVQTHELPRGPELERIARLLGFKDAPAFLASLDDHRERVGRPSTRSTRGRRAGGSEMGWRPRGAGRSGRIVLARSPAPLAVERRSPVLVAGGVS
jgi:glutamate-ammonia-ligase adenylyltransferase